MSPTLGRPVALGLVEAGLSRMGETVGVYHLGAERRATIAHRGRARSGRKAAPCVRWNGRRRAGGAELLVDRPRLHARRLDGLGQTLISGDLDAAVAALAPGAPMLGLYALAPEGAHALRIGRDERAARHARAARRRRWLARRLVRDQRRRRLGGGRRFGRGRAAGAHAGDLGRSRLGLALGRRPLLWPARPPRADTLPASASMSRRRGSRRCSPGSTASSRKPNRVAALDRFQQQARIPERRRRAMAGSSR